METRPLPPDWTSQYDDREQRLFFTNTLTQYRTWEDPRPAYYAQKEQQQQGYQQPYPSYPPPAPQQPYPPQPNMPQDLPGEPYPNSNNSGLAQEVVYNNSGGLAQEVVYNDGLSQEVVYNDGLNQGEEKKHSSGFGVGSAVAMAVGTGLLGAVAGGLIAKHQNHKREEEREDAARFD
ncbi:hypothetical protein SYNPS1DRAFT_21176 [Syncephalis pseudoplumigaleata]|uniref:WW domain-containing protein n=1 Tax=Syncephalis pseudoplumigaleata TaxID=1712513 RepID=A0A4P9Z593_9FUNG|nr:hypothetical protein SYNPS1DRAFT_21176 [Syncephalis pseudoplumigaleata]|eukprot:RKP27252.1 hypothetical protein SYNPS1DRAFT_21176 [Syncephalis pseudoplumigaleata]